MTIRRLLIGLAAVIVCAGLLSAWLAQRLIASPLIKVMGEIRHVERFDLDKVQRHPSRLTEIDNLSRPIGDIPQRLAAFSKYIPAALANPPASDPPPPPPPPPLTPPHPTFLPPPASP